MSQSNQVEQLYLKLVTCYIAFGICQDAAQQGLLKNLNLPYYSLS